MGTPTDIQFMQHALRLGARGLGRTWPNPSVGCVIVLNNRVIGAANTGDFGRPHAETLALAQAGTEALGATAYVTLEPCAHHGKTPPCAQALIDAGIARVVIAVSDPDSRVAGRGVAMLRAADIEIELGVCEAEAALQHRGFFRRTRHNYPYVALKIATSLDGAIADATGSSEWITGDAARRHGHAIRAQHDALITGIGTVLADDPLLTCRIAGLQDYSPVRVVLDTHLRTPLDCQLVATAALFPVWIITTTHAIEQQASHATDLRERGVTIITHDTTARIAPRDALSLLAREGITRVLVEAGGELSSAFMDAQCVDTLYWYRAPMLLGGAASLPLSHMSGRSLAYSPRFCHAKRLELTPDICDILEVDSCSLDS